MAEPFLKQRKRIAIGAAQTCELAALKDCRNSDQSRAVCSVRHCKAVSQPEPFAAVAKG
jgi:hypothetical protein